jgi:hypothetical protein
MINRPCFSTDRTRCRPLGASKTGAIETTAVRPGDQVVDLGSGTGTTSPRFGTHRRIRQPVPWSSSTRRAADSGSLTVPACTAITTSRRQCCLMLERSDPDGPGHYGELMHPKQWYGVAPLISSESRSR